MNIQTSESPLNVQTWYSDSDSKPLNKQTTPNTLLKEAVTFFLSEVFRETVYLSSGRVMIDYILSPYIPFQ